MPALLLHLMLTYAFPIPCLGTFQRNEEAKRLFCFRSARDQLCPNRHHLHVVFGSSTAFGSAIAAISGSVVAVTSFADADVSGYVVAKIFCPVLLQCSTTYLVCTYLQIANLSVLLYPSSVAVVKAI